MITKLVHSYQSAKLSATKKFSNHCYDILEEPGFMDNGYIRAKIKQLKKECTNIENEIELLLQYDKKDEYYKQKVSVLMENRDYILHYLSFLSSNSFNSLEYSISMIQNIQTDFFLCLNALISYQKGDEEKALMLFEQYFEKYPEPIEHFLINKTYGELLFKQDNIEKAVAHLRKATEKRPEDDDVHVILIQAYQKLGNYHQAKIHEDIQKLLGGVNDD
ncbi:tetratricopeptide repeat protein [Bacillus massiliigorillae]|uniref:tetratricopeptide repeat protein n=1 Tax=Bacillus massiliigorillae TaxID=1243664 RepID=UPI00039FF835|nr:tetratricopeptide repeat protein [Bacillus massiliigorillae]